MPGELRKEAWSVEPRWPCRHAMPALMTLTSVVGTETSVPGAAVPASLDGFGRFGWIGPGTPIAPLGIGLDREVDASACPVPVGAGWSCDCHCARHPRTSAGRRVCIPRVVAPVVVVGRCAAAARRVIKRRAVGLAWGVAMCGRAAGERRGQSPYRG